VFFWGGGGRGFICSYLYDNLLSHYIKRFLLPAYHKCYLITNLPSCKIKSIPNSNQTRNHLHIHTLPPPIKPKLLLHLPYSIPKATLPQQSQQRHFPNPKQSHIKAVTHIPQTGRTVLYILLTHSEPNQADPNQSPSTETPPSLQTTGSIYLPGELVSSRDWFPFSGEKKNQTKKKRRGYCIIPGWKKRGWWECV
jgi:hypothetical protein